jgi:hypothetical protein
MMRVASLFALFVAPTSVAAAQAPAVCPWLATGTAASVLGGEVSVTAHADRIGQGECHFSRQYDGKVHSIDVRVSKVNDHPCPEGSEKLGALGNEAMQCRRLPAKNEETDILVGRVRDVFFMVSISNVPEVARKSDDPHSPNDPFGASLLEKVAEQVAGNLF